MIRDVWRAVFRSVPNAGEMDKKWREERNASMVGGDMPLNGPGKASD